MLFTLELLILLVMNVNTISGIVNSTCTFENGKCGWSVNGLDRYTWKRQRGNARHLSTGPDKDHTTASVYSSTLYANQYIIENGYYFCTVSISQSKENDVSDLHSGLINPSPKKCLTFWYHMNGRHINTLKVFQVKNTSLILLWRKSGNQGNTWHFQFLSLDDTGPYKILFRATRGNGYKSTIAVDDICISNTVCKKVNNTSVTSNTRATRDTATVGISSLAVIFIAALVFTIVICIRRKKSRHSQPSEIPTSSAATERNTSSNNTSVIYNEIMDVR